MSFEASALDWNKSGGLIPVIVQDEKSLRVLMLGYMNEEALRATLRSELVTFFSRSKNRLWQKGETSGNVLRLKSIRMDCDKDTLLVMAEPVGPTCHLGTQSCFGEDEGAKLSVLGDLARVIHARRVAPEPGSYTTQLFEQGVTRMAQKVGEEGVEVALAATAKIADLPAEAADLLYHLLVLLEGTDTELDAVLKVLHERAGAKKGMGK